MIFVSISLLGSQLWSTDPEALDDGSPDYELSIDALTDVWEEHFWELSDDARAHFSRAVIVEIVAGRPKDICESGAAGCYRDLTTMVDENASESS